MIPDEAVEAAARAVFGNVEYIQTHEYAAKVARIALEAAAEVMRAKDVREGFGEYPIWEYTEDVKALLDAAAPRILESAAHDLAGADKTSHWDDLYRRFEEQDGGDLSSDSTAYLNGIADAMRFLQDRATTNPYRSQA